MNQFLTVLTSQRDQKLEHLLALADEIKALNLLISNQNNPHANYRPGQAIKPALEAVEAPQPTTTNTATQPIPKTIETGGRKPQPLVEGVEKNPTGSAQTQFLSPEQANKSTMPDDKN